MTPKKRRTLMLVVLGMLAGILWAAGMLALIGAVVFFWLSENGMLTEALTVFLAGLAASVLGWLMLMVADIFSRSGDCRVDAWRLAPCAALDLAVCLLYGLCFACWIAFVGRWRAAPGDGVVPLVLAVILTVAAFRLQKHAARRRKRWKEELSASVPSPD